MLLKLFLDFLIKHAGSLIIALCVLGLFGVGYSYLKNQEKEKLQLHQQIEVLTKDRDTAVNNAEVAREAAQNNQNAVDQLTKDNQKREEVTQKLNQQTVISNQFAKKTTEEISNAAPKDDGPLAPVLKNAIDAIQNKNEGKSK